METLAEMRKASNPLGFPLDGEVVEPADELAGRRTILDAHPRAARGAEVGHARGTGIRDGTDAEIAEAVAAPAAEVAIVVLGERSGLTDDSTTGEFRDRRDLGFLGRQQELLEAVVATGTPVVLVVVSGRPLALEWARHCAAVLWRGSRAMRDPTPSPTCWPATCPGRQAAGLVPAPRRPGAVSYRHHPSGGRSHWKGDYVDGPSTPLWPFGSGGRTPRSRVDDLRLDRSRRRPTAATSSSASTSTNTGDRAGDEVVQLYARDEEATVARPVLELRGFRRVSSRRGAPDRRLPPVVRAVRLCRRGLPAGRRAGRIRSPRRAGRRSDLPLSDEFELVGPTVELADRRDYLTETGVV